ncbi:MAG: DNA repair protein RecN [Candidatus Promineifilaceae bacterium]|nr:DNA repair protein RecN [Candidatus Promineifilaceae bacterium]
MLSELFIRNFAIIDELRLQFNPGFNALTGETGAGKSIILDAMALVLGDRADTTMVRSGAEEAHVEAAFRLPESYQKALQPLLEGEGLDDEQADILLLARELRLNGRNICRVNGRAVNLGLLREIGRTLVDIHGQGEHLSLLRPQAHLPLLDAYAGLQAERRAVAERVGRLQELRRELSELRRGERTLAQRQDMLSFQIEEIEAARLEPGEEEELRAERQRLANVEQLLEDAAVALKALSGVGDERQTAVDLVGLAEKSVGRMVRSDRSLEGLLERLQGLSFELSELVADLLSYQEELEYDPKRLAFVEERLELIAALKRKYGDDIEAVLAFQAAAQAELETMNQSEARVEELLHGEGELLRVIGDMAQSLSARRQAAAEQLERDVETELAELRMEQATFRVQFGREDDHQGAPVGESRLAFDEKGIDQVEFLMTANPGEGLKPLAKVASGGETSRLMLALKTALARVDDTPTLIFDEIDQGIGGRIGHIVGRKLWSLTTKAEHQVIVVTHLPQLAGYADGHFHVGKRLTDGRTVTTVSSLDERARVQELAEMLGTQGDHATGGAQSILAEVAEVKGQA